MNESDESDNVADFQNRKNLRKHQRLHIAPCYIRVALSGMSGS